MNYKKKGLKRMNDIESTIDYIKTNYEKLNIGIDYSNGKDHTAITLLDKQAELVIKALQEKAEREEGCATCNKPSLFIKQHKFPYCPHCGRKLGENNG